MFTQQRWYTISTVKWWNLLLLVCGLLLLIPAGNNCRAGSGGESMGLRQVEQPLLTNAGASRTWCDQLGWKPTDFGLKDHSVFLFDGFYYIASIRTPDEKAFVYARSTDLCNWDDLGAIIDERIRGEWDETYVWAPFVLEENGIFYMFYTGVNRYYTQSIMLAVSSNPADPGSWKRLGMIFQPDHVGMRWQARRWADCRDASVLKIGDIYYMVYTGRNKSDSIIGWAISFSPVGPWHDRGATLTLPQKNAMAESPTIVSRAGAFYLIYNNTSKGEEYRIGQTPIGPWSDALPLPSGWAHEIWVGHNGVDYTSFLQGYKLVIGRSLWDNSYIPPRLYVRAGTFTLFIPFLQNP
jgi:hypothetical protein